MRRLSIFIAVLAASPCRSQSCTPNQIGGKAQISEGPELSEIIRLINTIVASESLPVVIGQIPCPQCSTLQVCI